MSNLLSCVVAATVTITENQACAFTGGASNEIRVAIAGEEAVFAGFAVSGGTDGEIIAVRRSGVGPFITSASLVAADVNAPLQLAAAGQLQKALATQKYVARFLPARMFGGQGGALSSSDPDTITAGNFGRCEIEKGVM